LVAISDGRFRSVWWPTLDDTNAAKRAAHQGAYCALFIALLTSALVTLNIVGAIDSPFDLQAASYVDATAFIILGIFIWRMSLIAAILALVIYILELATGMANGQSEGVVAIIFGLFFVNGVRGTLAYRRFNSRSPRQPLV
jgi:hypothetical protein